MAKDNGDTAARDWSKTLFLPKTDLLPMKAGLPELEPRLLKRWSDLKLYEKLRQAAKGRKKYILHDGPPYANAHIHIGTALNKILKDIVVRSRQMLGKDANYVPGWDCHGLPTEWKIEEEYRAKGKNKDEVPVIEFRRECRAFAEKWIVVMRAEFERLGVVGDWDNAYTTMSFPAEASIANEFMKFAMNDTLYRGSKPVLWSVAERTALAEAEVEYHEMTSAVVWVKFPVAGRLKAGKLHPDPGLDRAHVLIWTTTPWTIPGNRAVSFNKSIRYGLYEVTKVPDGTLAQRGDRLLLADKLAPAVKEAARIEAWQKLEDVDPAGLVCRHPLHGRGYDFQVRLYRGDHVTEEAGTGFVHTAPGHGTEDYGVFEANRASFEEAGIPNIPHTVGEDGRYLADVPLFGGAAPKRVLDDEGKPGDADWAVIQALKDAGALLARGRLRHTYPHSWRSKAPLIFRNTPQWFIAMDRTIPVPGKKGKKTIRELALKAIDATRFVPESGRNRLRGMVEAKPDWVMSRQRSWGVPMTVFLHKKTGEYVPRADFPGSAQLIERIVAAFSEHGAEAWLLPGARERFLEGLVDNPADWQQVMDTIEVWFDSGSTHAYVLEARPDLRWPASLYLEGSDQHRGWFQSSLIVACGTRGRAPYETVLTHGFVMAEDGRKMSKSLGNVVAPQDAVAKSGADILRLWVASGDYSDDLRIGPEILKSNIEAYRKIRNTLRWMLGNLAHFDAKLAVKPKTMPELDRLMLHRLAELDALVWESYEAFDFKRIVQALSNFCINDLSAFYFDIRKDALYCEPPSSVKRRACLTALDHIFRCLTTWFAPMLCFTCEEVWLARTPSADGSVHLQLFPKIPKAWRDAKLAEKWEKIRSVRRVVTGAMEIERAAKRIGANLEAALEIYVADPALYDAVAGIDFAEVAIASAARIGTGSPPAGAFTLSDVPGVSVVVARAEGRKCARSWRITQDVGSDPQFPDLSVRDAAAVRELDAISNAR